MYEEILTETRGDVEIVTLNRPQARNALTYRTYAELGRAVEQTRARCLVLTGADPAFCSGDDVKQIMAGAEGPLADELERRPRLTPTAEALRHTLEAIDPDDDRPTVIIATMDGGPNCNDDTGVPPDVCTCTGSRSQCLRPPPDGPQACLDDVRTLEIVRQAVEERRIPVLVVGIGRIGRRVARLSAAFGMEVIAADPFVPRQEVTAQGYSHVMDFREVLPAADFVTLHMPGNPDGSPVMTAAEFQAMRPGAYFINAARGSLVDEPALEAAVVEMMETAKIMTEGAGAAPLAALATNRDRFAGRRVGLVVSGANIDSRLLASLLMRGLARAGRMARLRILVPDEPGHLARVAGQISDTGANIVEVYHQRLFSDVPAKETELDVVIETRDEAHIRQLIELLTERGFETRRLSDTTRDE